MVSGTRSTGVITPMFVIDISDKMLVAINPSRRGKRLGGPYIPVIGLAR